MKRRENVTIRSAGEVSSDWTAHFVALYPRLIQPDRQQDGAVAQTLAPVAKHQADAAGR